jgi:hypothetical protein
MDQVTTARYPAQDGCPPPKYLFYYWLLSLSSAELETSIKIKEKLDRKIIDNYVMLGSDWHFISSWYSMEGSPNRGLVGITKSLYDYQFGRTPVIHLFRFDISGVSTR